MVVVEAVANLEDRGSRGSAVGRAGAVTTGRARRTGVAAVTLDAPLALQPALPVGAVAGPDGGAELQAALVERDGRAIRVSAVATLEYRSADHGDGLGAHRITGDALGTGRTVAGDQRVTGDGAPSVGKPDRRAPVGAGSRGGRVADAAQLRSVEGDPGRALGAIAAVRAVRGAVGVLSGAVAVVAVGGLPAAGGEGGNKSESDEVRDAHGMPPEAVVRVNWYGTH